MFPGTEDIRKPRMGGMLTNDSEPELKAIPAAIVGTTSGEDSNIVSLVTTARLGSPSRLSHESPFHGDRIRLNWAMTTNPLLIFYEHCL